MGEEELDKAMHMLEKRVAEHVLQKTPYSTPKIFIAFITLLVILIMLLVFILLGVEAFTKNSSFEAVVNSTIVAGAGVGMGTASEEEEVKETTIEGIARCVRQLAIRFCLPLYHICCVHDT